jgi:hypothetical protein
VSTTDSAHEYLVYPNLAGRMNVERINQLWVAWPEAKTNCRPYPLTRTPVFFVCVYVRLLEEFVYVAVILDAHSRGVVGLHVGEHLDG